MSVFVSVPSILTVQQSRDLELALIVEGIGPSVATSLRPKSLSDVSRDFIFALNRLYWVRIPQI